MLLSLCAGAGIFLAWRLVGMPLPGTGGRLLPLTWVLAGIVLWDRSLPRTAMAFLCGFAVLAPLWPLHGAIPLLASASAAAGALAVAAEAASGGRIRLAMAVLALGPVILYTVPFTGDEPHYAALSESIIVDRDLDETNNLHFSDPVAGVSEQLGGLSGSVSHHQPLMSLLVAPGLVAGAWGMRAVSLVLAAMGALVMAGLLRTSGCARPHRAAFLAVALMPALGILGTLYPGLAAVGLLCLGVWGGLRGGRAGAWALAAAVLLLPLLKLRFAALSVGLFAALLVYSGPGRRKWLLLAAGALVAAVLAADWVVLGGRFFWIRYGNLNALLYLLHRTTAEAGAVVAAPLAALVDAEVGLVPRAPWVLAGLAGLPALWRRRRRVALWLGLPAAAYLVVLFLWLPRTWHSMPTPAGRMMVPLLPLLAAAAWQLLDRGGGRRVLVVASLAVAGAYVASPGLRFNLADGTDALLTALMGPRAAAAALPSLIRPNTVHMAAAGLSLLALLWVTATRFGRLPPVLLISAAVVSGVGTVSQGGLEAEDLGPEVRRGCRLYPFSPDPLERYFWFGGQQRLLRMGHPRDRLTFGVPGGADSVRVAITAGAMADDGVPVVVACGSDTARLSIGTELLPPPAWVRRIRRRRRLQVSREPGNLADTVVRVTLPAGADSVSVGIQRRFSPPEGLYLDRVRVEGLECSR
jgi:hypothetical protein